MVGTLHKRDRLGAEPRRISRWIWAYVGALPFLNVLTLPVVGHQLQLPELLFLPLLFIVVAERGKDWLAGWGSYAFVLLGYCLVNLLAAVASGNVRSLLEAGGKIYLVLVAFMVADHLRVPDTLRTMRLRQLLVAWRWGVIVACSLAVMAYLVVLFGGTSAWVSRYEVFPYFGRALRMSGPTGHPAMLVLVTGLPVVWSYYTWRKGEGTGWWLVGLLPVLILTFSKEILLVVGAMLLADPWLRSHRRLRWWLAAAPALLFWVVTHVLWLGVDDSLAQQLRSSDFTSGEVLWQGNDRLLAESCYVATKRAGVDIGAEFPFTGVGPGNFSAALSGARARGSYPTHLPDYDPHSTLIGAFAETGVAGCLLLILLIIQIWRSGASALRRSDAGAVICVVAYLILLFAGAVSLDVMNHRYLWVAIGVVVGYANRSELSTHRPTLLK